MKKSIYMSMMIFVVLTGFLSISVVAAQPATKVPVIVGFKEKANPDLIAAYGGSIKYTYTIIAAVAASLPPQAIEALKKNPNVLYVEADHEVYALDTELDNSWGVDRIDAEVVHTSNNKGAGIQVAVLDTGIDYTHEELDARYLGGYDFANSDNDPLDDNGHGTHCSGIIAAEDNGIGVVGVAPEADLYAVKVLDKQGSGYLSDVIAGIDWATVGLDGSEGNSDDAEVISMSLGSSSGAISLEDACNNAYSSGTLVVASAGNEGDGNCETTEYSYPAAYSSVIAVGAIDQGDNVASFSNSGPFLELVAPGVNVYSTMPTYSVTMTSTGPPPFRYSNNYDSMSGTSMACPHVAGTAALVFATGKVATEVRSTLQNTAEKIGYNFNCQGYGLVDAEKAAPAVDVYDIAVTAITAPNSVVQGDTVTIDVTVENQGSFTETFDVVLTDDTTTIGTSTIESLTIGASTTVTFSWNTVDATIDDHSLTATAGPVTEEGDTTDNSMTTVVTVESALTDIAITTVNAPSSVTQGDQVDVIVTIENVGNQDVTTDITVTLYDDDSTIGTQTISGGLDAGYSSTLTFHWDTSSASIEDHTLTASHDFSDEDSTNDSEDTIVTVNEPSVTTSMHVGDLDGSKNLKGKSGRWEVFITVTILDENNNPVANAEVTGEWSSAITGTVLGTTGSDGTITFTTGNLSGGNSVTFTVNDVTHDTLIYDSSANSETSITVDK